jgi:hypothetical protein
MHVTFAGRSHRRPERRAGRFEVKEPGGTGMVSVALATLDLVPHDDAQPAFPAVHPGGHAVLSCGELAGLAGESERVLRHEGKALVLRAGGRDLPALPACPAVLRPGHAVAFLPASDEVLPACQPGLVAAAPGSGTGLAGNTAAVVSALGLTAAVRAPAMLGIWPARCASCPAGRR